MLLSLSPGEISGQIFPLYLNYLPCAGISVWSLCWPVMSSDNSPDTSLEGWEPATDVFVLISFLTLMSGLVPRASVGHAGDEAGVPPLRGVCRNDHLQQPLPQGCWGVLLLHWQVHNDQSECYNQKYCIQTIDKSERCIDCIDQSGAWPLCSMCCWPTSSWAREPPWPPSPAAPPSWLASTWGWTRSY